MKYFFFLCIYLIPIQDTGVPCHFVRGKIRLGSQKVQKHWGDWSKSYSSSRSMCDLLSLATAAVLEG